jgi:glycosyltransferase involved in cell wall biosynthesis
MRITQLMLSKGFGGAERYFVDLTLALDEAGHEVQVICNKHFKQIDQLRQVPTIRVDTVAPLGWWDVLARRKIRAYLIDFQPVVVQAHLARGAHMAGKICKESGIPLIVKMHNYVDLKYYRNVDCFIPTTIDQQNYLIKQGIDAGKISVTPNFSSITPANRVETTRSNDPCIFSYGRFVKKKGFDVLLLAVKRLIETGRKINLYIGGDGPELNNLRKLCSRLGLEDYVTFTGWVDDIRVFADKGDIFVLPSLDEPFGIAVLEMMALGKPIIATRTKGPVEILDDDMAYLVDPGNESALADALVLALGDASGRLQKAEKALYVFREKYSKEVVVTKLLDLYLNLVNRKSN